MSIIRGAVIRASLANGPAPWSGGDKRLDHQPRMSFGLQRDSGGLRIFHFDMQPFAEQLIPDGVDLSRACALGNPDCEIIESKP
jgi:hypothetical protein